MNGPAVEVVLRATRRYLVILHCLGGGAAATDWRSTFAIGSLCVCNCKRATKDLQGKPQYAKRTIKVEALALD